MAQSSNSNSQHETTEDTRPQGQGSAASPATYRQEDDRRRDEARTASLQSQVDELSQGMRELVSRQKRHEEETKQREGEIAQLKQTVEQLRHEAQQTAQARALDENRTRQVIEDFETRLDDGTRPIRSLQAHVTELLEQSRRKVDDTSQNQQRFDELVTMIEHLSALGDRTSALSHGLRDNIETVRTDIDGLRRDILRAEDSVKIIDQESRRRTNDVQTVAESYSQRIDELRADLTHIYDSMEDTRRSLVHVDPSLDELRAGELALQNDMERLQTLFGERYDSLTDMQDDARQETDSRFEQLRQMLEERADRLNERLEEANDLHRDVSYKVTDLNAQIEELRQVDGALHRDLWYLHEQRVRVRLEQVQEELDVATSQRRDAEGEAQSGLGNRFRRRRLGSQHGDQ